MTTTWGLDIVTRRTAHRKLGSRQAAILAYARLREAGGQPFPTYAEIRAFCRSGASTDTDLYASLLGLHVRGLIEPVGSKCHRRGTRPATWRVTALGWAQP